MTRCVLAVVASGSSTAPPRESTRAEESDIRYHWVGNEGMRSSMSTHAHSRVARRASCGGSCLRVRMKWYGTQMEYERNKAAKQRVEGENEMSSIRVWREGDWRAGANSERQFVRPWCDRGDS